MRQTSSTNSGDNADEAILRQMGERITSERLRQGVTQQGLADEAGVSRSTIGRMEAGESTQLSAFIRVLRVLQLLDGLTELLPANDLSPIQALENKGQARRRASKTPAPAMDDSKPWKWGDDA